MSYTLKRHLMEIGIVLLPLFSPIASSDTSSDLSKAAWLEQVRAEASVPICKSFIEDESIASQMKIRQINFDKCVLLIPDIAVKCEKKYDTTIPSTINDENAEKWGRVIGECIGHDFAMNYLYSVTQPPAP